LFGPKPTSDKPGETETKPLGFPASAPTITKPGTGTEASDAGKGLANPKPDPSATAAVAGGAAPQVTEAEKLKEE